MVGSFASMRVRSTAAAFGDCPSPRNGSRRWSTLICGTCSFIYWTPSTGAQLVHGALRDRWASMGWELSSLGYPVSDEYAVPGGRRSNFAHGSLTYRFSDGAVLIG